jgi:hypothetical protein
MEVAPMSIVRVGVGETKNYAEGWELIFGKKESTETTESKPTQEGQSKQQDQPAPKAEQKA